MPKMYPIDWDLNTIGFWSNFPNTYVNPNFVYPPWGLILMAPYQLMQAEGARFFSVLVIGWLVHQQKWPLSKFFAVVLSPYFIVAMLKSNMDILVLVLPILLWRRVEGTRWQNIGWGLALSLLLLKPQGALFIWLYLFWISRKRYKEFFLPLIIVALVCIPISLIGSPPLIIQWLSNIMHPSPQNSYYWSINNVSLTYKFTLPGAFLILICASLILIPIFRYTKLEWTNNRTISALLFISMFSSPYTSQQSISSALAFVPSWAANVVQTIGLIFALTTNSFYDYLPLWVLLFAISSFLLFIPHVEGST
jgi:hypothetical protein